MDRTEGHVFVIDDDLSVCRGLSRLLHSAGYTVETFTSAKDYLLRESYDGVACIVLDVRMPQLSGTELQDILNSQKSNIPIIFLTAHGDVPLAVDTMKKGAEDFLTKPVEEKQLLDAVERALHNHDKTRRNQLEIADAQARLDHLTPREMEVLQCVIGGATNKQIAEVLNISEKTVKIHRGKVMHKLNVSSAAELGWLSSFLSVAVKKKSSTSI